MDYALAKELKKAGYPFDLIQMSGRPPFKDDTTGTVYAMPNLEDLVDACGERGMFRLDRHQDIDGWEWQATTPHLILRQLVSACGSTKTEAVARLWIALNQTNHV